MEVYLDNSATTMCYPEVGELVYNVMCRDYGNPSSMHAKACRRSTISGRRKRRSAGS